MISHLETEGKKETFKIDSNPCKVIGLAEPHQEASEPADSAQLHKSFPIMSMIFLNFFPQSVKFYEHKTRDSHLKMVNSECSLFGLLNSALTQLLYLKRRVTKKVLADFVDASVTYNRFNVFPLWWIQIRLSDVFWPVVSIWYMYSGQDRIHEYK